VSTKVLYIAGSGRSGSTILDNILGELDGFVSAGEVRFVWERGMRDDRTCACGEPFSSCPFWGDVLTRAYGGRDAVAPGRMIDLLGQGTRARRIPSMVGSPARRHAFVDGLGELSYRLSALYRAIADVSAARVIVDSSKLPTYGLVLDQVPGVDLRVVHLVRDPRATAYSWRRRKALPDTRDGRLMQRQGPLKASGLWTMWNTAAGAFWRGTPERYLRLRYEDVIREPMQATDRICAFVGEDVAGSPFVSNTEVRLTPSHSVAGNPSRVTTGLVTRRPDDEWQTKMRRTDRALVTTVTWPLLLRYHYVGDAPS
jgi:hypothetical protein